MGYSKFIVSNKKEETIRILELFFLKKTDVSPPFGVRKI